MICHDLTTLDCSLRFSFTKMQSSENYQRSRTRYFSKVIIIIANAYIGLTVCQVLFQVFYIYILSHLIFRISCKGSYIIPILQIAKMRHGKVKTVQDHMLNRGWSWDLNPSRLAPESILLMTVLYIVSETDPGKYRKGRFSGMVEQKPDCGRGECLQKIYLLNLYRNRIKY